MLAPILCRCLLSMGFLGAHLPSLLQASHWRDCIPPAAATGTGCGENCAPSREWATAPREHPHWPPAMDLRSLPRAQPLCSQLWSNGPTWTPPRPPASDPHAPPSTHPSGFPCRAADGTQARVSSSPLLSPAALRPPLDGGAPVTSRSPTCPLSPPLSPPPPLPARRRCLQDSHMLSH